MPSLKDDILTIIWSKRNSDGSCGWINRTEIASTLGRSHKFLETGDIWLLRELVDEGAIEMHRVAYKSNPEYTFAEYRAVE